MREKRKEWEFVWKKDDKPSTWNNKGKLGRNEDGNAKQA